MFKIGNNVEVIDNGIFHPKGSIHTVTAVQENSDGDVFIALDDDPEHFDNVPAWNDCHFKLVKTSTKISPEEMINKINQSISKTSKEGSSYTFSFQLSNKSSGMQINSTNVSEEEIIRRIKHCFEVVL